MCVWVCLYSESFFAGNTIDKKFALDIASGMMLFSRQMSLLSLLDANEIVHYIWRFEFNPFQMKFLRCEQVYKIGKQVTFSLPG